MEHPLTETETELLRKVQEGSLEEARLLLNDPQVRVDCLDEQGMTPLQHAAYKGNYDLCKLFLDRGANVNANFHTSKYSALMFASLSGKTDVVNLLLEHGASITDVNSVGRNASQMAAFVGNHEVVTVINYFVPKEEIEYYTKSHNLEKEPKLPPSLCSALYKFLLRTNIHPVNLAVHLMNNIELLEKAKNVATILELLCHKEIKKTDNNELLAVKLHYMSFLVKQCDKYIKDNSVKLRNQDQTHVKNCLEPLIKSWIKGRDSDGFPVILEQLLRQSIREFPNRECSIFQTLVRTLAPVAIGDEPSAISILVQTVSGQKGCPDGVICTTCGEPKAEKKCSACKSVQYCNKECQKLHWFSHKKHCKRLAIEYQNEQANISKENESTDLDIELESKLKIPDTVE